VDLRRQLSIVRAWFPLVIGTVVLAAAAAYFISGTQPKVYEAKATLIVGQSLSGINPDYNQLLVSQRLSTTYANIATTRSILAKVIAKLGMNETPERLALLVSATAAPESALLTITGRDGDPVRAANLVNAMADELIAASPTVQGQQTDVLRSIDEDLTAIRADIRTTQGEIERLTALTIRTPAEEARLETLQGRVASLRSTFATLLSFSSNNASNLLTVVQAAVPPEEATSPRPILNALIAAIVGLLVAAGIIYLLEYLDDTIKDASEVQVTVGLPTLGTILRMKGGRGRREMYRLATLLNPRSPAAEAYRSLRTNIEFASLDTPVHTLLVTSAIPAEGKTVTAANLAIAFAQAGRRTLLIDADLRQPDLHELFRVSSEQGLTTLLRSDGALLESVIHRSDQENLAVLTSGPLPPNPAELLGSQRMKTLLSSLSADYELLIFDSPPVALVTDAVVLSSFLEATVLVVDTGRTRRAAVRQAREALAKAGARVLGVVLNGRTKQLYPDRNPYYPETDERPGSATPVSPRRPEPSRGPDGISAPSAERLAAVAGPVSAPLPIAEGSAEETSVAVVDSPEPAVPSVDGPGQLVDGAARRQRRAAEGGHRDGSTVARQRSVRTSGRSLEGGRPPQIEST
jgi:succinoglycan biosynthesis transport protein ExoP